MKRIAKDILIGILYLVPILALDTYLVGLLVEWLVAHGMDANVPDAGPLREKHDAAVSAILGVAMMFAMLLTFAPCIFLLSHFKIWIWNPNRPWVTEDTPVPNAPTWTVERLRYEQANKRR